jgi:di/tricarboxylate transporter
MWSFQDALEMPVLIMISAAFGISEAMVQSGAAHLVARALMGLAGKSLVRTSTIHISFMSVYGGESSCIGQNSCSPGD